MDYVGLNLLTHTVLSIISGLIFQKLSIGLYFGIIVTFSACIICLHRRKQKFTKALVVESTDIFLKTGALVFIFAYLVLFYLNSGKWFTSWDEYSHWGAFLKESLRLDNFYCVSELNFAHKDYVPAFTMF